MRFRGLYKAQLILIYMTELELLEESKLLGLMKYIIGFGLGKDEEITADPWAPWPFP